MNVQVNVVSLSAGVYILQNLSEQTRGEFCLARNKDHLEDLMERFLVPSETESHNAIAQSLEQGDNEDVEMEIIEKSSMIQLGFPTQ